MISSPGNIKKGFVCLRCGETEISEDFTQEANHGICPENEGNPHIWRTVIISDKKYFL